MSRFAVILPAGGSATRFGRDKLAEPLGGEIVLSRTIRAFTAHRDVACIVLGGRDASPVADERIRLSPAGDCRAATVFNALQHVPAEIEWVAVHDAARPLVSQELI